MKRLGKDILNLRRLGMTYNQISKKLGCAKSTISYYCGDNQKLKSFNRSKKNIKHPYVKKIENFKKTKNKKYKQKPKSGFRKLIKSKIETFTKDRKNMKYQKPNFTIDDVINKFGYNPKCYLTGISIDIYNTSSYHFDHIIPRSKGGDNSIENLGICTREANQAKSDMKIEDFVELCKLVVKNYENV